MTVADTAGPREAPAQGARTRTPPDLVLAAGVGVFVAAVGVMVALLGTNFFYVGDNPESFIPLWHHFGTELRSGRWNTMEASAWMGGNYAGEAAYAQWNPLLLLAYVVLSFFGDLAVGAAVLMISMLSLLGMGAFALMRSYGVGKAPAVALASAVPFTGFTLYYEAAGWPAGLSALIGVTFFWLAVRQQTVGAWPPVVTFVFGYLAVTTGNPYALLGILVVLLALFVELVVQRQWRSAVHLVVVGGLIGSVALLVFLPLLGVQPVTARQELAGILNDTFLVPDLGDLAGSSTASYLPTITNWGGAVIEALPSTYLAWFALPLLPWVRWAALWRALRAVPGLLLVGLLYAVATLGPSNLWLFRWPIRLIEYLYLVLLVILALGVTEGMWRTHARRRTIASAVIVGVGAFLALAGTPAGVRIHAVSVLATVVLLVVLGVAWRRRGIVAAAAVLLLGTAAMTSFQAIVYPRGAPVFFPPSNLAQMTAQGEDFEGTVLQLAQQSQAGPEAINTARIMFGNLSAPLPYESVNRYSGISFQALADALCIDYKGVTCPEAYERLSRPVENTGGDLADAMRISTLVLQRSAFADAVDDGPPPGWSEVDRDDVRVVWVRDDPLIGGGRVSGTSEGVTARSTASTEMTESVEVTAARAGYVTFARLAWPGYSVQIDGATAPYDTTDEGLVQVPVPAGSSVISLSYTTPGLAVGWITTGIAALLAVVQSVWWYRDRRKLELGVKRPDAVGVLEPGEGAADEVRAEADASPIAAVPGAARRRR